MRKKTVVANINSSENPPISVNDVWCVGFSESLTPVALLRVAEKIRKSHSPPCRASMVDTCSWSWSGSAQQKHHHLPHSPEVAGPVANLPSASRGPRPTKTNRQYMQIHQSKQKPSKPVRLMDPSMAFQEVLAVLGMGQPIGLTQRGELTPSTCKAEEKCSHHRNGMGNI